MLKKKSGKINQEIGEQEKRKLHGCSKVTWNKEALKAEVEAYDTGRVVNWSELARQYEVKDGNGNLARNGG